MYRWFVEDGFSDGTTVDSHVTIISANASVDPACLGSAVRKMQSLFESMATGATNQMELNRTRRAGDQNTHANLSPNGGIRTMRRSRTV